MNIGKGKKSSFVSNFKRYYGAGVFNIVAINPNKDELSKIYGTELEKEPEYIVERDVYENGEKKGKKTVSNVVIYVKSDPEHNNGIEEVFRLDFPMSKNYVSDKDGKRWKVLDCYGNSSYLTKEDFKSKTLTPRESDGWTPTIETSNMKLAREGEAELVDFVKTFLNIAEAGHYSNEEKKFFLPKEIDENCMCMFTEANITNILSGNVKVLKDVLLGDEEIKDNYVGVVFSIRESNNKLYQTFYRYGFYKANQGPERIFKSIDKQEEKAKKDNRNLNTIYYFGPLKEYSMEPTNFENKHSDDNIPFAPESSFNEKEDAEKGNNLADDLPF